MGRGCRSGSSGHGRRSAFTGHALKIYQKRRKPTPYIGVSAQKRIMMGLVSFIRRGLRESARRDGANNVAK